MNRTRLSLAFFLAIFLGALPWTAIARPDGARSDRAGKRPEVFEAVVRCRAITETAARLQCYDTAAANLEQAANRRDVVVVDREQVREDRRRLFGLALPRLGIFGGGDDDGDDAEEVIRVVGVVASASQNGFGQWVIRLQDGAVWAQTDNNVLALRPRPGQKVVVNRGALGSYMMRVNNQPGLRVKRLL
jgi:hypothetical protein